MAQLTPNNMFFRIAVFTALLAGIWGCSDATHDLATDDGGRGADAGVNEPTGKDGVPPFDAEAGNQGAPLPAEGEPDGFTDANSCFDNTDNDADDSMDCSDEACQARGSCCVGNTSCCEAAPGASLSVDFGDCTIDNIKACHESLELFGSPLIDADGLTFDSDLTNPGGVISSQALDPRVLQRVLKFEVDARCTPTTETLCAGTSGVSLVRANLEAPDARPDVMVGLQAFATNRRIGLVIENTVVSTWNLQDSGAETWSLQVSPSGEVKVHGPGRNFETYVNPDTDAYAMVHGQGADAPAITKLSIDTLVCDAPRAWLSPSPLSADDGGPVLNPSIAMNSAGETWVAFEREGRIYFGQLIDDEIRVATTKDAAFFPDSEFFSAVRVADPELVWERDRWTLFFTGYAEDTRASRSEARGENVVGAIVRATIDPVTFESTGTRLVLAPYGADQLNTSGDKWGDALDFEMPTIAVTENPTYPWVMIVRTRLTDGTSVLRAFKSGSGVNWDRAGATILEARTQRDGSSTDFGFDSEDIVQPSLLVQNRAYHLYYEGRRGERSSIGLLVSDDLLGWRDMSADGAIYEEGQSDFDRLGAGAADVLFDGQSVRMLYIGDDGSTQSPVLTRRAAPNSASM